MNLQKESITMKNKSLPICLTLCLGFCLAAVGCNNTGSGTTEPPVNTKVPIADQFGTLSPIFEHDNYVNLMNEDGMPLCSAEFFRLEYDHELNVPRFAVIESNDVLKACFSYKLMSGLTQTLEEFDEEYYENYFTLAIEIPLTSGSTKISLLRAVIENGSLNIYLSTDGDGEGTADMATQLGVISLDRNTFGTGMQIKVFLNDKAVEQYDHSATK